MIDIVIKLILFFLIIFTPIAFGSVELWAFSVMELGILLILVLWAIENMVQMKSTDSRIYPSTHSQIDPSTHQRIHPSTHSRGGASTHLPINTLTVFLSLFLLLILFQMLPLPSGILKILSPRTWELRQSLSFGDFQSAIPNPQSTISFVPFVTQINFFKWLTLIGLFIFLLRWKPLEQGDRTIRHLVIVVMIAGVFESLYGMFEFFSGHGQILNLEEEGMVSSVTGTFINRNYFAGYLLMVVPLGIGYLFSREAARRNISMGWRHRLASLDGKTLLLGFGVIVMVVGLIFSASRMGISSLLLSFTLISFLFRDPQREKKFSKTSVLIFGLALLWAIWIGLDTVLSRFITSTDDFKFRWTMWANTFQILKDFPLFGSGLGTFTYIFPMYRSLHIQGLATHAENDFLQLASEVGLVGIGLLLILFLFLSYKAISGIRLLTHRDSGRYIAMGGLVGILALMFHSLVERNIQVPSNAFLYTILWGVVLNIRLTKRGAISPGAYQNTSAPVGRI
jgi:O-antigen ligase